ncbi:MAG: hypothetical protein ABI199_05730 [Bacteroidia bacterium]
MDEVDFYENLNEQQKIVHNRYKSNLNSYCFGFNGQEKTNELCGIGNAYDFKYRMDDARLGRWLSLDKLAAKIPFWSPYSYGYSNPILYLDADGLFPFAVTVRSFVPPDAFKYFDYDDDKRGFSAEQNVTSRISQTYTVDPTKKSVIGNGHPTSSDTKTSGKTVGNATHTTDKGKVDNKTFYKNAGSDVADVEAHYSGSNPDLALLGTAPNIEVNSSVILAENDKAGYLIAYVDLSGKEFPATEALVSDAKGQTVWLTGSGAKGNPLSLYFDNTKKLGTVDVRINIDSKGNFTGVEYGGKTYTLKEWNKNHISKPATNK